jgi:hypothetical protein
MNDMIAELFKPTYQNKKPTSVDRSLQSAAIATMIKQSGLQPAAAKKSSASALAYEELITLADEPSLPCSLSGCTHNDDAHSFLRVNFGLPGLSSEVAEPLMTGRLKKILQLYKSHRGATSDASTRDFYDYQIIKIGNLFK